MNVDHVFTYHAPNEEDKKKYEKLREAAKTLATTILEECPSCADRTAALRKLRECIMTANASIALDGRLD